MPESIIDQLVKHTAKRSAEQPAAQSRSLANRLMWLVILWCAGFGATFLFVLPFHLLMQWAMHH